MMFAAGSSVSPRRSHLMSPAFLGVAAIGFAAAPSVHAAVITDPARVIGANAIDPTGSETVDVTPVGATAQDTLEALSGFGAVQNFTGLAIGNNIISFTEPTLPDIRLTRGGDFSGDAGDDFTNSSYATSGTSAARLKTSATNAASTLTLLYTIEFGQYDTNSTLFTPGSAVQAAGFTLSNIVSAGSVEILFKNSFGATLSTQTVAGASTDPSGGQAGIDAYSGRNTDGTFANAISSIQISLTSVDTHNFTVGLDDLGFTAVVPEPASAALLLGGAALLLSRRSRG